MNGIEAVFWSLFIGLCALLAVVGLNLTHEGNVASHMAAIEQGGVLPVFMRGIPLLTVEESTSPFYYCTICRSSGCKLWMNFRLNDVLSPGMIDPIESTRCEEGTS